MFGLQLIKTASLNKLQADNAKLKLEKEDLRIKTVELHSKIRSLDRTNNDLKKQLAINKPIKDPKTGRFVKKVIHSEKSRVD